MFCSNCGKELNDDAKFCFACGAKINITQTQYAQSDGKRCVENTENDQSNPVTQKTFDEIYSQKRQDEHQEFNIHDETMWANAPHCGVSFGKAIKLFFGNAFDFEGRSSRSEYWWAWLFNTLIGVIYSFIKNGLDNGVFDDFFSSGKSVDIFGYFLLAIYIGYIVIALVPGLALFTRRMHDIGKHGYAFFVALIPIVGPIILIAYVCTDSVGDNEWGYGPYH